MERNVIVAREDYIEYLENSIAELAEHRNEAVEALYEARDEVHRHINDSVDALYGQKTLQSNLNPFLAQCDMAAMYLLAVYRDSNKASRQDEPPAYFQKEYHFDEFTTPVEDDKKRTEAEKQARETSMRVESAVKEIFNVFHNALQEHAEIDEIEDSQMVRVKKILTTATETAPSVSTVSVLNGAGENR